MAVPTPLNGKVIIVTGASSGIGKASAIALAAEGASVIIAARRLEKLKEVQDEIQKTGGRALPIKCDVTIREQVKSMVREAESSYGPIDVLVNNAGVFYLTLMKNLKEEQWDETLEVNCKGVNNCIGAVLCGMIDRKRGHIVNITSNVARKGEKCMAVYSGSKFYVEGLSQSLRKELLGTGVKVTCIQPGDTQTDIGSDSNDTEAAEAYSYDYEEFLKPEDVAKAVVYAISQSDHTAVNEVLIEPRDATSI